MSSTKPAEQTKNPITSVLPKLTAKQQDRFPILAGLFCAFYIISNVLAIKSITIPMIEESANLGPIQVWPLVLDGAFIIYPFMYILDDIITEIYGFKRARKVIFTGLAVQLIAVLFITLAILLPATPGAPITDELFATVIGYVPRIIAGSLLGYLAGELINSFSMVLIRKHTGERKLWVRLIGSTVIGEAVDTVVFCTVAFIGTITFAEFLNYTVLGYIVKCLIEVIMLPVTYRVIRYLKAN